MTIEVLTAVVVASLLGSVHCVGMCGPFAIMATGAGPRPKPLGGNAVEGRATAWWWQRGLNLSSYHMGRLATYLVIGALVGSVGVAIDGLAGAWGISAVASKLVGGSMIAMGVWRLWASVTSQKRVVVHSAFWQGWSQILLGWRKRLPLRGAAGSAFSWGLISTWLPCGWLYVFALAAAGAGGVQPSMILMAAFWVGTLPLLSALSLGTTALGHSLQRWVQPLAATVLIAFGVYTMVSRSQVDFSSLRSAGANTQEETGAMVRQVVDRGPSLLNVEAIRGLVSQKLPCCEPRASADGEDGAESASMGQGFETGRDAGGESCEHCCGFEKRVAATSDKASPARSGERE